MHASPGVEARPCEELGIVLEKVVYEDLPIRTVSISTTTYTCAQTRARARTDSCMHREIQPKKEGYIETILTLQFWVLTQTDVPGQEKRVRSITARRHGNTPQTRARMDFCSLVQNGFICFHLRSPVVPLTRPPCK